MENIILTNNKDLRLVSVKVGVLSTLRFELPLVSASATHVEVIVTSGTVHSAYTATFIPETKRWQCDIAASQFPEVGKQSYEVAYVLDGKQFWDGKGWIEIEDATTSGIEPQPRPEPYRYTVLSVNGYGADAQGAVRIPKMFIATDSPATTEGYIEGDIYFNRETGATWTLCNVQGTLTWVFNYKPAPSTANPQMDGTAAPGTSAAFARGDHVHPTDTSRMAASATGADIAVSGTDATKISAALAGKASTADATLTERFSAWTLSGDVEAGRQYEVRFDYDNEGTTLWALYQDGYLFSTGSDNPLSTSEDFPYGVYPEEYTITATRTALQGYKLGSQTDKPLASEAEAEALRTGKQDALTAQQLANIAAVSDALAFDATHSYAAGDPVVYNGTLYTFTSAHTGAWTGSDVSAVDIIARLAGKLDKNGDAMTGTLIVPVTAGLQFGDQFYTVAVQDVQGNKYLVLTDDGTNGIMIPIKDGVAALASNIPYTLTTKTISNGAVTLDDRASNSVTVSATLSPNTLTINFPTAPTGKLRDFGLRLSVASGITTAPELVLPQGITFENADGEVPEIGADGAATILYFTETASGVFLVKGEVVTAIS